MADTIVVRANWPKTTAWLLIVGVAFGLTLIVIRAVTLHQQLVGSTGVIVGAFVLAIAIFEMGFYFFGVREIRLTRHHAEFVVGLRRVVVPWADLVPPVSPLQLNIVFDYPRTAETKNSVGLGVTKAQARAILTYPSCPRFELDTAILRSLGFSSNPKS